IAGAAAIAAPAVVAIAAPAVVAGAAVVATAAVAARDVRGHIAPVATPVMTTQAAQGHQHHDRSLHVGPPICCESRESEPGWATDRTEPRRRVDCAKLPIPTDRPAIPRIPR